mmetsp:Transcript_3926/g.5930  ORF Transcript_3926/g.5930 Transcript_3926/m.5930 type:complete len:211 (+) Transcript_3926:781-1413(+)
MNSGYHSIKTPSFGVGDRQSMKTHRFQTPGPGTYRPPSDFGYIDKVHSKAVELAKTLTPFRARSQLGAHEDLTHATQSSGGKTPLTKKLARFQEAIPEIVPGGGRNQSFNRTLQVSHRVSPFYLNFLVEILQHCDGHISERKQSSQSTGSEFEPDRGPIPTTQHSDATVPQPRKHLKISSVPAPVEARRQEKGSKKSFQNRAGELANERR